MHDRGQFEIAVVDKKMVYNSNDSFWIVTASKTAQPLVFY